MDNFKTVIGLTLAGSAAIGFVLTFIGARLGKSIAGWGVAVAIAATALLSCRPLTGAFPGWPTTDALYRAAWTALPLALLSIVLSFKKLPGWCRALVTLLATAGGLLWIFTLYPAPSETTQTKFLLEWAGIGAGAVLILWLLIEPIAVRSPGVCLPLIIGFLAAGLGTLNLMSSSTKSGNLIAAVGSVAAGTLIAAMLSKPISFARGPAFIWLTLLAMFYVPSCYDADGPIPWLPLLLILGAPLLAWPMELKFFKRWKPWKRELLRGVLVAAPVVAGIVIDYQQKKSAGDLEALNWSASQSMSKSDAPDIGSYRASRFSG